MAVDIGGILRRYLKDPHPLQRGPVWSYRGGSPARTTMFLVRELVVALSHYLGAVVPAPPAKSRLHGADWSA